jgi:hypothetical protein
MAPPLNSFGAMAVSDVIANADGPYQPHGLDRRFPFSKLSAIMSPGSSNLVREVAILE